MSELPFKSMSKYKAPKLSLELASKAIQYRIILKLAGAVTLTLMTILSWLFKRYQ